MDSHYLQETFDLGTPVTIQRVNLSLPEISNLLAENSTLTWNIVLNNTLLGQWIWTSTTLDPGSFEAGSLSIVTEGSLDILMKVASSLPLLGGSVALALPGELKIWGETYGSGENSSPKPVPEPATLSLLAAGIFGIWVFSRKKSASSKG